MATTKLNSAVLRAYACPTSTIPGALRFISEPDMAECLWLGNNDSEEFYINELEDGRFFAANNSLDGLTFAEKIKEIDLEAVFEGTAQPEGLHRLYGAYFDNLDQAVQAATDWYASKSKPPRCYNPPETPEGSPSAAASPELKIYGNPSPQMREAIERFMGTQTTKKN